MIKPTRTVDRDLWGDDDIFVRVDIRDGVSDKKIGETPLQACSDVGAACSLFVSSDLDTFCLPRSIWPWQGKVSLRH